MPYHGLCGSLAIQRAVPQARIGTEHPLRRHRFHPGSWWQARLGHLRSASCRYEPELGEATVKARAEKEVGQPHRWPELGGLVLEFVNLVEMTRGHGVISRGDAGA